MIVYVLNSAVQNGIVDFNNGMCVEVRCIYKVGAENVLDLDWGLRRYTERNES